VYAIVSHAHYGGDYCGVLHRLLLFIWSCLRIDVPNWASFSLTTRRSRLFAA
jgi:hypothetical protein